MVKHIWIYMILVYILFFACPLKGDIFTEFNSRQDVTIMLEDQEVSKSIQNNDWKYDGEISANPITFEPPFLDFSETPIGEPKWYQVKIFNNIDDTSVHLFSIYSSKRDVHCSIFKSKILKPKYNTTFDLVFLPTHIGKLESHLQIQTSKGTFIYKVFGIGISSLFRLVSFEKFFLPVNESITNPIYFYNPLNASIQILEMYTSGGDVHLEFPTFNSLRSKKAWNIQPYETRTIMKVKIIGRKVGNYTSFLRIRTNSSQTPLGFVLPIYMEISNDTKLYILTDKFYFGILRTHDAPKTLKITVFNNGQKDIYIKNIYLNKSNPAIDITFHSLIVSCCKRVTLASVTYTGSRSLNSSNFQGDIIIQTNQEQIYTVPYYVNLIHGSLVYDANNTKFLLNITRDKVIRNISITNTFSSTIAIYKINVSDNDYDSIKIYNFSSPLLIKSNENSFFTVIIEKTNVESYVNQIALYTNVSLFMIPVFIFNGKLKIIPLKTNNPQNVFDFGMLQRKKEYNFYFKVKNENPIDIKVLSLSTNWHLASIKIVSVRSRLESNSNSTQDYKIHYLPVRIRPYNTAVFHLKIATPDINGVFSQEIIIKTNLELIRIDYYLRTSDGTLNLINQSPFPSFPTKTSIFNAEVVSSFFKYLELISIHFSPNVSSIQFEVLHGRNFPILINPRGKTLIGIFKYRPHNSCEDPLSNIFIKTETISGSNYIKLLSNVNGVLPCYLGFSIDSNIGYQWLKGVQLNENTVYYDIFIYKRLKNQYDSLITNEENEFNIGLQFDTSVAKGFLNDIYIKLHWPSLVASTKSVNFPLTQIGNYSYEFVILENPSDRPLIIQMVLMSDYPDLISFMKTFDFGLSEIKDRESFSFFPSDNNGQNRSDNVANKHVEFERKFSVKPHSNTLALVIPPKTQRYAKIYFNPNINSAFRKVKNYVIIRNNLTAIEVIELVGEGGYGKLSFQNGHNQESTVLNFELTEKHLKNCDVYSKRIPNFSVRRPFVIKNIGRIPVYVSGFKFAPFSTDSLDEGSHESNSYDENFSILRNVNPDVIHKNENMWCSGYGFEVVDCNEYKLEVNQSIKLEIVFTPDFSLHRVLQQLQIYTSLSKLPFNVTVQASLPVYMLHRCSQALARPDSEILIWYMALVVITLTSISAMLISYYEADRIFTSNVIYRHFSSVALGIYNNSTNEFFDLKNLDGRNTLYNYGSNMSKSYDYFSTYNNDYTSLTYKRKNVKKNDEKQQQQHQQSSENDSNKNRNFGNSTEKLKDIDEINEPLIFKYVQQKKRKKRSLFFNIIQWFNKFFYLLKNPNTPLKPKLESVHGGSGSNVDNFKTNYAPANDIVKTKFSNTHDSTPVNGQTNHTPNVNNQPNKRSKRNNSNSCVNNSNKFTAAKSNDLQVFPLDFDPIDIPPVDHNKNKKNLIAKKVKKANNSEETRNKESKNMEETVSLSDSSFEEKMKDTEIDKPVSNEENNFIERNKRKDNLSNDVVKEVNTLYDVSEKWVIKEKHDSSSITHEDVVPNKYKDSNNHKDSITKTREPISKAKDASKSRNRINLTKIMEGQELKSLNARDIKTAQLKESKCEYESDELIEWENENLLLSQPEDLTSLSARTEYFSEKLSINEQRRPNLTAHYTSSAKKIGPWGSHLKSYFPDNSYQIDPACQIHGNVAHVCNSKMDKCMVNDNKNMDCYSNNFTLMNPPDPMPEKVLETEYFNREHVAVSSSANNFMSLELPSIAQGRKQSLLDYERRSQIESLESDKNMTSEKSHLFQNEFLKSQTPPNFWDREGFKKSKYLWTQGNQSQTNDVLLNSFWSSCYVKPGSGNDILAQKLIPTGILSVENSGMNSAENPWKYDCNELSKSNIDKEDN